jgi:inorganic triphosphatase YgiF
MANEVELKLSLPSIAVQAWMQDSELGEAQNEPLNLDNQYFDTPDLLLNMSHAALRIRKSQHGYKQTLKNKGTAIAGLHSRGEWEYDISAPEIQWDLFPSDVQIAPDIRQAIQPLFKTDFTRHVWIKTFKQSTFELVLDEGLVSTGANNIALCEVELELMNGNVQDLFEFALQLADKHPLVPCDVNKAERGYHLINPNVSFFSPQDFAKQLTETGDINVHELLQESLSRLSRNWDDFSQTENWRGLLTMSRYVQAITYVLKTLLPTTDTSSEDLIKTWEALQHSMLTMLKPARVVIGLDLDGNSHSRGLSQRLMKPMMSWLNQNLSIWIEKNALGVAMLKLGQYLHAYPQAVSFQQVLLPVLQGDIKSFDSHSVSELEDLNTLQALAFILKRIDHPLYDITNQYVRQSLVVLAMADCKEVSPVADSDSRAKLASWVRRLTVEYRQLNENRLALIDSLSDF